MNKEKARIIVRDLIRDEQEAIIGYEKAVMEIKNEKIAKVLNDIKDEEKVHIGELEALLAELGEQDFNFMAQGTEEAIEKLAEAVKELNKLK